MRYYKGKIYSDKFQDICEEVSIEVKHDTLKETDMKDMLEDFIVDWGLGKFDSSRYDTFDPYYGDFTVEDAEADFIKSIKVDLSLVENIDEISELKKELQLTIVIN